MIKRTKIYIYIIILLLIASSFLILFNQLSNISKNNIISTTNLYLNQSQIVLIDSWDDIKPILYYYIDIWDRGIRTYEIDVRLSLGIYAGGNVSKMDFFTVYQFSLGYWSDYEEASMANCLRALIYDIDNLIFKYYTRKYSNNVFIESRTTVRAYYWGSKNKLILFVAGMVDPRYADPGANSYLAHTLWFLDNESMLIISAYWNPMNYKLFRGISIVLPRSCCGVGENFSRKPAHSWRPYGDGFSMVFLTISENRFLEFYNNIISYLNWSIPFRVYSRFKVGRSGFTGIGWDEINKISIFLRDREITLPVGISYLHISDEKWPGLSLELREEILNYSINLSKKMWDDVVRSYLTDHGFYLTDFITLGKYAVDYWRWDYPGYGALPEELRDPFKLGIAGFIVERE